MQKSVLFFDNGNTCVFVDRQQQADLQEPWLLVFAKFLEDHGHDPLEFVFETQSGNKMKLFRIEGGGFNWRMI